MDQYYILYIKLLGTKHHTLFVVSEYILHVGMLLLSMYLVTHNCSEWGVFWDKVLQQVQCEVQFVLTLGSHDLDLMILEVFNMVNDTCEIYGQFKRWVAEQTPGVLTISHILYHKELFIFKKKNLKSTSGMLPDPCKDWALWYQVGKRSELLIINWVLQIHWVVNWSRVRKWGSLGTGSRINHVRNCDGQKLYIPSKTHMLKP